MSAHGGDQFPEEQKESLNRFYNYFYLSINIGAIASNYAAPAVTDLSCFGDEPGSCYTWAYAMCAVAMLLAWLLFMAGKRTYIIVPPVKQFLPWIILKCLVLASFRSVKDGRKRKLLDYVKDDYSVEILQEVRDVSTMFWVLLPAPLFWLGYKVLP